MLRVTQQTSSDAAKSYFAQTDYYIKGQELTGVWGGKGAKLLGLEGDVQRAAFGRLCDNLHPITGKPLTVRTRSDRTVGYDFTWSVPKSVSLAYSLFENPEMLDAFRSAVGETMREIETGMQTRIRKGGKDAERTTGNLAWAEFVHFTSRPVDGIPDPQLHAHCFVFNATRDGEENAWKAGQFRELKRDAPYYQAAFRARFANKLTALGYRLERKKDDFELAGVAPATIREFSRRTEKIEREAQSKGITDPDAKGRLGSLTREAKDDSLPWDELQKAWDGRLSDEGRRQLAAVSMRSVPTAPSPERADVALKFAIEHSFERNSVISEKELLAEALRSGLGQISVEDVAKAYRKHPLLTGWKDGRKFVTTRAVVNEERDMIAFARRGRGTRGRLGVEGRGMQRHWLNEGQRKAVAHVLQSSDRVILVRGAAGTGKTTMTEEAVEAIHEGGHRVVMLAPTAAAARGVLRSAGFSEAETVAAFLRNEELQNRARGQVLWVDEAGLLGSRDVALLFCLADRLDARIVLMGDRFQHGSVARGSPLRLLETEAGVPSIQITDIVRQSGKYKQAVVHLSAGDVDRGFDELDKLGWIKEVPTEERYRLLAEHYVQAVSEKDAKGNPKSALVVAPTHAEGEKVTHAIRDDLRQKKKLGEDRIFKVWTPTHLTQAERGEAESYQQGDMLQFHQNARGHRSGDRLVVNAAGTLPLDQAERFQVYRPAEVGFAVGDRIRITANGKTKDKKHSLNNGVIYTVAGFTKEGDIRIDHDWVIAKEWGHVAQGYAVTSHSSQGRSVDKVFIAQSAESFPASSREQFYVSVSRGEKQALVFTDDKKQLAEAVRNKDSRLTATDLVGVRRKRLSLHLAFRRRSANLESPRSQPLHRESNRLLQFDRETKRPGKEEITRE